MAFDFDPKYPVEMFNTLAPDTFQIEIGRTIYTQYAVAAKEVLREDLYLEPEAKDLLPHLRRALIESVLGDRLARYSGFQVNVQKNKLKNCSHRIIISDRILITQSYVRHRGILPREAVFREGYARSRQGLLFDEDQPPAPDPSKHLYAIIVHSHSDIIQIPQFIDIIFPDENCKNILDSFSLLDKYPQIRESDPKQTTDDMASRQKVEPNIKLKRKKA